MPKLYGLHWLFWRWPWHIIAGILIAIKLAFWLLRFKTEGIGYNSIALSGAEGDDALSLIILMAANTLNRHPQWFEERTIATGGWHIGAIVVALVTLGVFATASIKPDGSFFLADVVHAFLIAPLFAYALTVSVPVLIREGSKSQVLTMIFCGALWLTLVVLDSRLGLLNQHQWLMQHGLQFP